jgi:hypothetical protein
MKTNLNTNDMFTREELEEQAELEARQQKAAARRSRDRKRAERKVRLVAYRFNPNEPTEAPKAGDTVADCHASQQDKGGNARLHRASVVDRKVKLVYMSDAIGYRIKMNNGDIAYVRPASVGHNKWETFIPGEKQKVVVK